MSRILVVDDERGVCHSIRKILGRHGHDVSTAHDGSQALQKAAAENIALVIMDVSMPGMDGIETLQELKKEFPDMVVIMMTAHSTSERAITAMKYGAYDYLTKPFDNARLLSVVEKALSCGKKSGDARQMSVEDVTDDRGDRLIGRSPAMLEVLKKIGQIASSDVTVLITGETGTGKEKVARAIHNHGSRAQGPFLPVNCSAIPENLLESELFGHEKGAFTGAERMKKGKFEQSSGGIMFLDEIGDMPLPLQSKLLRVVEDGCFQRLGGTETIRTDVRIIAATNRDIGHLAKTGEFRDDLYWRLNVVSIHLPPLRERSDDLEEMVVHFIQRFNSELDKNVTGLAPTTLKAFKAYHWPGNVRELQSIIQRGMVVCQGETLSAQDCDWPPQEPVGNQTHDTDRLLSEAAERIVQAGATNMYRDALSLFEHLLIRKALEKTGNNQALAARLLKISRNTLREKMGKTDRALRRK